MVGIIIEVVGGGGDGRGDSSNNTFLNLHERLPVDGKSPQLFCAQLLSSVSTNQCEYWVLVFLASKSAGNRFSTWFSLGGM